MERDNPLRIGKCEVGGFSSFADALTPWRIAWKIDLTVTIQYTMTWKWTKRPNKNGRPKTGFNHPAVAVCN